MSMMTSQILKLWVLPKIQKSEYLGNGTFFHPKKSLDYYCVMPCQGKESQESEDFEIMKENISKLKK